MLSNTELNSFFNKRNRKSFYVKSVIITYTLSGSTHVDTKLYKYVYGKHGIWYQISCNKEDKGEIIHWFGGYHTFPYNYTKNTKVGEYDFRCLPSEIADNGDIIVIIEDGNIKNEFKELDVYYNKLLEN